VTELPPVTLVLAPEGYCQFAWETAQGLVSHIPSERLYSAGQGALTMAQVRELVRMVSVHKLTHAVLWLDDVSPAVYPALLKTLEESPVCFVLAATSVPPTVMSRSQIIRTGLPEVPPDADAKNAVTAALSAVADRDQRRLARSLRNWYGGHGEESIRLLGVWAAETVTGRWRVFAPADGQGLDRKAAESVLRALREYSSARPRIAASAALESVHDR
jgi:hypothetical protein